MGLRDAILAAADQYAGRGMIGHHHRGIVLLLVNPGYREPPTKQFTDALQAANFTVRTAPANNRLPAWGVPDAVKPLPEPPVAIVRWEEHGCTFVNQAWRNACAWCHQRAILPVQIDWGYFQHYRNLILDVYQADASTSIKRHWADLPETVDWDRVNPALKSYRQYMADEWRIAGELGPVPNVEPGYVLIYLQHSHFLSILPAASYQEWCARAAEAIQAAGLRVVFRPSRVNQEIKLPEGAAFFDERNGIEHLNTRLLRFARHSIIITSTVSHEAVLRDLPIVACGRGWFSGLGVFAEAKTWADLARTPDVDPKARAKWIHWWAKIQRPNDRILERFEDILATEMPRRRALYVVARGWGNLMMTVPALKAISEMTGGPVDVAGGRSTQQNYLDVLRDQPWIGATYRNPPDLRPYQVITGAAFPNYMPSAIPAECRRVPLGPIALWPHEVLRHAEPARSLGFGGALPSPRLRIPYPKTSGLPTRYVTVAMDCTHGSQWDKRRWPHWQRFCQLWAGRCPLVFLGVDPVPWASKHGIDLIGKTQPVEVAAIIQQAEAHVGIVNGPAHAAACARTPSVILFGPTTSLTCGPWHNSMTAVAADIGCRPCFRYPNWTRCADARCMAGIAPERVVDVLDRVLSRRGEAISSETAREQVQARMNLAQQFGCAPAQRLGELAELWRVFSEMRPRTLIEIGNLRGGWFYVMAPTFASPARLFGIDPTPNPARDVATRELRAEGHETTWIGGRSQDAAILAQIRSALRGELVDVLHIDGDHSEAAVLRDWDLYLPLVRPGGAVVLHDADGDTPTNCGVAAAVQKLRASKSARASTCQLNVELGHSYRIGTAMMRMAS
jgi:cephalosporin hydroxylase